MSAAARWSSWRGPLAGVLLACLAGGAATGCGSKKKEGLALTGLSAEVGYQRAINALARHKLHQAREEIERMQYATEDRAEIEPLSRLALADAAFYKGSDLDLIDARSLYLDFVALYGNHPLAPYAQLQAGLCSLKQVRHPSRDQTQTYQALEDLRVVGQRFPGTVWDRAADDLSDTARANLAEHEFGVGKFYLDRNAHEAAAHRFRGLLEGFPEYPEKEKVLFHLGQALRRLGQEAESRAYLARLVADFPDSDFAQQARKVLDDQGDEAEPGKRQGAGGGREAGGRMEPLGERARRLWRP